MSAEQRGTMYPPRWLQALATRWVRGVNADLVLADLADEYGRRRRHHGALRCATRYLRLAVASRRAMRGSDGRALRLLGALAADGRFSLRGLRKNPGFATVAILTLALGLGANAAIFSVVHGVLLAPLPYPQPERVVNIWQIFREWQASEVAMFRAMAERFRISWPVYQEWSARSRSFDAIAVYGAYPTIVDSLEVAEWVNVVSTTRSFIDVVGVEPARGRWFNAEEDRVGGERVVIISDGYWRSRLGGREDVLGTTLRLHGDPFTVIGVMPPGFYFPSRSYDMWYPVPGGRRNDRFTSQSMAAVARLAEGVTLAEARDEMDAIAEQIIADIPDAIDAGVRLVSRVEEVTGSTAGTLRLLASAVGLVLLVAAANVAGLLSVRTSARRQELAVRSALGARSTRLFAQLLVEGAVLALAAAAVALVVVVATLGWLRAQLPANTPRLEDIAVTWQVAAFVAATAVGVAAVFGIISSAQLRARELVDGLRQTTRVFTGSRGRALMVVGEIAASVVLLTAAALLAGSYLRLASVESGIRSDGLLSLQVAAPIDLWHDAPDELRTFFEEATGRLQALPGVAGVATVSNLPFSGSRSSGGFGLVPEPQVEEETGWSVEMAVSAAYFEVMGIPILAGRALAADAAGPREMVVNERFVAQYFPQRSPIGEIVWEEGSGAHVIVGVAADVRHARLDEQIEAKRYRLFEREIDATAAYVLRLDGHPSDVGAAARAALLDVEPGVTVSGLATITELIRRTTALPRFRTILLAGLAVLAILMSAIGLYGVIALSVAGRRREFGLRMTLGAGGAQLARLVLRDGLRLTVPGIALGLVGSLAATAWVSSYLYGVEARDPLTLSLVVVTVAALALAAMALPAWRALRVDPMVALRSD